MIPWELVDTAPVPGGTEPLRLLRRGQDFVIRLGSAELMSSRVGGSEAALARLGCADLAGSTAPRVLIGGLGMGFTLRAALALLPPGATVTVAELVPEVVAWGRGPLASVHAGSLDDPRVTVMVEDVGRTLRRAGPLFDAVLLDVDNGPDGLTLAGNDALYGPRGLAAAHAALHPGGTLAVWSAEPDDGFTHRLRRSGFAASATTVRASGRRGARHVVWIARRPG